MILLSALLASLSGFVAGERPAARAQVEVSAQALAARPQASAVRAAVRPMSPALRQAAHRRVTAGATPRVRAVGTVRRFLSLKQSWLE